MLSRAAHALEHHPKQISVALAVLLLATGGGAFAVASLGPDPSAMPVRQVLEAVQPLSLQAQVDALDTHRFSLYTSETVRPTDSVDALLARLGINDPAAAAFLRQDTVLRTQVLGVPGRLVNAEATDDRNLRRLAIRWAYDDPGHFKRLVIERQPDGRLASRLDLVPLTASLRLGTGTIRSSLFAATDEAGIPDAVTNQMVDIFSGTIDFSRGLRLNDRFAVVYETLEADGEPLRTGRVISADFTNAGRRLEAMWYQQPGAARGGYFNFNGESLERAFLASPMEVSRVTSGFAMRLHPILQDWRAHKGVDYSAPTGTPVRTIGDGKVDFAGVMSGYGNVVRIDHGHGDSTLYAHLSQIDVRVGQALARGDRVGAVGSTGWATGPHLHFEFLEKGQHRDPLEVARSRSTAATVLAAAARPDFERAARALQAQLAAVAVVAPVMASAR